jgi:hypothetical protein
MVDNKFLFVKGAIYSEELEGRREEWGIGVWGIGAFPGKPYPISNYTPPPGKPLNPRIVS